MQPINCIFLKRLVLLWYDILGLAVNYVSICSSLYVKDFHRGCKCLKVLQKENKTAVGNQSFLSKIFRSTLSCMNHLIRLSVLSVISSRAAPELIFTNFFIDIYRKWISVFFFNDFCYLRFFFFRYIDLFGLIDDSPYYVCMHVYIFQLLCHSYFMLCYIHVRLYSSVSFALSTFESLINHLF